MSINKIAALYHYCEVDNIYRDNFLHFLVFAYLPSVDFYIIISGDARLDLPKVDNLYYFYAENINLDYGGYAQILSSGAVDVNKYEKFIFVNSSVRGPYLPAYCSQSWISPFLDPLEDKSIGLVGSSINILPLDDDVTLNYAKRHQVEVKKPLSHVQTTIFSMRGRTLKFLQDMNFFSNNEKMEKSEVIQIYEIALSQTILKQGLNIKCLLPEYNSIDYRLEHYDINPESDRGDPLLYKKYFGRTVHPYEAIYVKTNRMLYDIDYLNSLSASMLCDSLPSKAFSKDSPLLKGFIENLEKSHLNYKRKPYFWTKLFRWVDKKLIKLAYRRGV